MDNAKLDQLQLVLKQARPDNWKELYEKCNKFYDKQREALSGEILLDEDLSATIEDVVDQLLVENLDTSSREQNIGILESLLGSELSLEKAVDLYAAEKEKILSASESGKPLPYKDLVISYKAIQALLPTLEQSEDQRNDAEEVLGFVEEEIVGLKKLELAEDVKKEVRDLTEYVTFEETADQFGRKFFELKYNKEAIDGLAERDDAEALVIAERIKKLQTKIILKEEEALLEIETRDYIRAFYKANQLMTAGEPLKAKPLYYQFLKEFEDKKNGGIQETAREEVPEVVRAIESLKQIAALEIAEVSGRLESFDKSIASIPSVNWHINKMGVSKDAAQRMIKAQRKTLAYAQILIEKNPSVLSLGDAIKLIEGINEAQYGGFSDARDVAGSREGVDTTASTSNNNNAGIAYVMAIGLADNPSEAIDFFRDDQYGDWKAHGVSYFVSKFGTEHEWKGSDGKMENWTDQEAKYVEELDAIRFYLDHGSINSNSKKRDLSIYARRYQDLGLYSAAEEVYDMRFKELYAEKGKTMNFEDYYEAYKKDEEKMRYIEKDVDKFVEQAAKQSNRAYTSEEKDALRRWLIEKEWKNEVRASITEDLKDPNYSNKGVARDWAQYNEDYLKTDRDWYEVWSMSLQERDRFIESLPVDLVSLAVTGGASSFLGKGLAGSLTTRLLAKELVKMGLKQAVKAAFEQGGKKAVAKLIGAKLAGFALESAAFSELNVLKEAAVSGDWSIYSAEGSDPMAHLKAWGHSALALGVLKAVDIPFARLENIKGFRGAAIRAGVKVPVDTAALTALSIATNYISGERITDAQVSADIRNNAVFSLGVRVGHGILGYAAKKIAGERGPNSPTGGEPGGRPSERAPEGERSRETSRETRGKVEKPAAREKVADKRSVDERIEDGGYVEIDNNRGYNEAMDALEYGGYKMELNANGELVGKKPGKPDVTLRETGKLARESAKLQRKIEGVNANPSKENIWSLIKDLRSRLVPESIISMIVFLALIPRKANAKDFGDMLTDLPGDVLGWVASTCTEILLKAGIHVGVEFAGTLAGGSLLALWIARASLRKSRLSEAQGRADIDLTSDSLKDPEPIAGENKINTKALKNGIDGLKKLLKKISGKDNKEEVDEAQKAANIVLGKAGELNDAIDRLAKYQPGPGLSADANLLQKQGLIEAVAAARKALNDAIIGTDTVTGLNDAVGKIAFGWKTKYVGITTVGNLLRIGGPALASGAGGLGRRGLSGGIDRLRGKGKLIMLILLGISALAGGGYLGYLALRPTPEVTQPGQIPGEKRKWKPRKTEETNTPEEHKKPEGADGEEKKQKPVTPQRPKVYKPDVQGSPSKIPQKPKVYDPKSADKPSETPGT